MRRGDRRALARAITLVESSRPDHRAEAERLIGALLPETSSAGESGGGIARGTREAILLCEAAGFDAILVETVGIGQAETAVAEIVDMFVLILPPAGGDELQGIKRGVIELADLVLVNKADGELAPAAHRTVADYASAMGLIRPPYLEWQVPVRAVSALEGTGIHEVWDDVARFRAALEHTGTWSRRRTEQARAALWSEIGDTLLEHFRAAPGVTGRLAAIEEEVMAGSCTPTAAARELLKLFVGEACESPVPRRHSGLTKRGPKA
jgi:LAO/AO transport system kinase